MAPPLVLLAFGLLAVPAGDQQAQPGPQRVLLVAGVPSWEFRFLRNSLIRDKTIDVSCWLMSADKDYEQSGNTVIKGLPDTAKAFARYQAVLLLDPNPDAFGKKRFGALREAVLERGVGLCWVVGETFGKRSIQRDSAAASIIDLLPVEPDLARAQKLVGRQHRSAARWKITDSGRTHRLTRIHGEKSPALWRRLPGYHWAFPTTKLKDGAVALFRHPHPARKGEDGGWPIIALREAGKGRVLYLGIDETYRWRGVAPQAYAKFWMRGLRWLSR